MLEEAPLHDRVRVYEDDEISCRGGDSPVVGAREADVLFVPDQTRRRWKLGGIQTVVVHDDDLEVPVARRSQGFDAPQRQRPRGVVDDEDRELYRDLTLSRSRRAMLAVAASEDSLSSLRTSASGILFFLWISARFSSMSGR